MSTTVVDNVKDCGIDYRPIFNGKSAAFMRMPDNSLYFYLFDPASQLEISRANSILSVMLTAQTAGQKITCDFYVDNSRNVVDMCQLTSQ
jgi:hypothetical protein